MSQIPTDLYLNADDTHNPIVAQAAWPVQGSAAAFKVMAINFDSGGYMWGVGTDGTVCKTTDSVDSTWASSTHFTTTWLPLGNLGSWDLKMLAFDNNGRLWGVRTDSHVGVWSTVPTDPSSWDGSRLRGGWNSLGKLDGWNLSMITFDNRDLGGSWTGSGDMYCVGTSYNVGKWSNKPEESTSWTGGDIYTSELEGKWANMNDLGSWSWIWFTFRPQDTGGKHGTSFAWPTGKDYNIGQYDFDNSSAAVRPEPRFNLSYQPLNWKVRNMTFKVVTDPAAPPDESPRRSVWFVGTENNIGLSFEYTTTGVE